MPAAVPPSPGVARARNEAPHGIPGWRWLPLVLAALLYVGTSFGPAIYNQTEAQYAGAAREMLNRPQDYRPSARAQGERGRFLVPTNNGVPRLQKPPLVYWTLIASMKVFGVNDFSARLPNALAMLAWLAGTVALGVRMTPDRAAGLKLGLAAATVLATMMGTFVFGHLVAPEPFLGACLTWTFWCLSSACVLPAHGNTFLHLAWVCMGLGAMTKGLHAVVYPLAAAGVLAWRQPDTRPVWKRLFSRPTGWLILATILVPWYAYIEHRYPGFLWDQLINEQLGHVVDHRYPPDSSAVPLPIFGLEHLVFFLPWTFFIPAAWRWRPGGAGQPVGGLLAAWFWITLLSVIFSSLQDYYLMTAFGPVAFWLARPWVEDSTRDARSLPRWTVVGPGAALGVLGLFAVGLGTYLRLRGMDAGRATNSFGNRDQLWATVAGFSVDAWEHLLPLLWGTGSVFLAGGIVAVVLAMRGNRPAVLASTAVMMLVVFIMAVRGMGILEDYFSQKRLCEVFNRAAPRDAIMVRYGPTYINPSVLYYLDREVYWLGASPDGEFASRRLGINRHIFLADAEFTRRWESASSVYLCIDDADLAKLRESFTFASAQLDPVAHHGTTVLLVNHPPAPPSL